MKSSQGRFQIVDIVDAMKPLTKLTHQIVSPTTSRRACARLSASPRKSGPVRPYSSCRRTSPRSSPRPPACAAAPARAADASTSMLDRAAVDDCRSQVRRCSCSARPRRDHERPAGCCRSSSCALGIPFFTTQMGKGVLDGTGSLGTAALSARDLSTRHREGRPDHQRRPRRDREAAVLHARGPARVIHVAYPSARSTRSTSRRSR